MDWQAEEDIRCGGCGLPRDVTMAPGKDQDFDVEVLQCHACGAKGQKAVGRKVDDATRAAEYYVVTERS